MNRTIASLAVLKVNWDCLKKDYIENFIPFIATLIKKNNYGILEINKLCNDFKTEFGLLIPYHPMCTILNRARKRGLIKKSSGSFMPVTEKVTQFEFSNIANEQLRKHGKVINEFIDFAAKHYKVELTKEKADSAFISFLKDYDLEILFATQHSTVLPSIKISNREKFLIYIFIKHSYEAEPEIFRFIVDIAIGHILATALLYSEFNKFRGKLRGINFYFDTKCILRLLGVEGQERENVYIEFLKILLEEGGNLFIFQHTYEEIRDILEDSLRWIENSEYDPILASPASRYFVQNNYTASDVERFIVNADRVLKEYKINIVEAPDLVKDQVYQVDEKKLYDIIVDNYREHNPHFNELEKSFVIQRDVKSISSIYKLRKGCKPHNIKEAGHIFVTINFSLAYANRKFEISEQGERFIIPACLTDIFVGTLVWLQTPTKVLPLNEKKIIADCYAALQPNDLLIKKYLNELGKLKTEKKINEDEYYLLRTHRVAMDLLEEKTMGDPNNFTDKTSEEILEEIRGKIKAEEGQKYLEEKKNHSETLKELDRIKKEKEVIEQNIEKRGEQISTILGRIVFGILIFLFILGTILQVFPNALGNRVYLRIALLIITLFLGFLSVTTGFNIKGLRDKIKIYFKSYVIKFIREKR